MTRIGGEEGEEEEEEEDEEEAEEEEEQRHPHDVPETVSASIPISTSMPISASIPISRPSASAAMDLGRSRSSSIMIKGDVQGAAAVAGAGEDVVGSEDDDGEDEKVALATAAAAEAQAASVARSTRPRNNSLIHQSASFRPHMHLQMQALSNRHNGTFSTRFVGLRAVRGLALATFQRLQALDRSRSTVYGLCSSCICC